MDEAQDLSILLRSGALSAPMEIVEERTVGPSLGESNILAGKNSMYFGLFLVALFMFITQNIKIDIHITNLQFCQNHM